MMRQCCMPLEVWRSWGCGTTSVTNSVLLQSGSRLAALKLA